MALEHPVFSEMLRSEDWGRDLSHWVIDEAHCISEWGKEFRKKYAQVIKLRSLFPIGTPVLAPSATMTPDILADICKKLGIDPKHSYHVNLGNDRPNITPVVWKIPRGAKPYQCLNFLVEDTEPGQKFVRTIVYVTTRDAAQKVANYLRSQVDDVLKPRIAFMHSGRSKTAKRRIMREFRDGNIDILVSTDVVGLVSLLLHAVTHV